MTDPVSPNASESRTPHRSRVRIGWLGLATTLVLLVGVEAVWASGEDDTASSPPATTIHAEVDHAGVDHPSAASHADSDTHAAEASTGDEHADHDAAAPTEHEAAEEDEHANAETPAQVVEPLAQSEAHSHGAEAASVSIQTKQVVLGGLAGINGLVVLAAAIFRRRNPPRLPKYLQSQTQTQGSKP